MYKEYLGDGYHEAIRKMLVADEKLCPNSMVDADFNIGAMKIIIAQGLEKLPDNPLGDNELKFQILQKAARYYLAGVLCTAIKSRIKHPPFNAGKYKKNWDKKRKSYMDRGWKTLKLLLE